MENNWVDFMTFKELKKGDTLKFIANDGLNKLLKFKGSIGKGNKAYIQAYESDTMNTFAFYAYLDKSKAYTLSGVIDIS